MQIRLEVEKFRLELVRFVSFTIARGQISWVDRVFGTSINTDIVTEIENSAEWKQYLDDLSFLAETLAQSQIQQSRPERDVNATDPHVPMDAPGASVMSEALSRERRLERFKEEHGVTLATIMRAAKVHKPDFQAWRKGRLKAGSVVSRRIELVLSGETPV